MRKVSGSVRGYVCRDYRHSAGRNVVGDFQNKWILLSISKNARTVKVSTTLAPLEEQVLEVLHDQASRGQIIVLPELEAFHWSQLPWGQTGKRNRVDRTNHSESVI